MSSFLVHKAKRVLKDIIERTPLIQSVAISKLSGRDVFLKLENLQETGAFKLRGAAFAVSQLSLEQKRRGVIAASQGNHAQGVACSAAVQGVSAVIVMPLSTPRVKVDATRRYGAEVILYGKDFDEAYHYSRLISREKGLTYVHPFDDPHVIAGQGTIGLEIIQSLKDIDAIIVPVGGGGLLAGVLQAVKLERPEIKIIGVEPVGACAMAQSLKANRIVELTSTDTHAEGVAVRRPGNLPFEMIRYWNDGIVTVNEAEIKEAFLTLLIQQKMLVEYAGVLGVAALGKLPSELKRVVCLVSGGNIDPSRIQDSLLSIDQMPIAAE